MAASPVLLPERHGPVTFRSDSAHYQLELLRALRAETAYEPSGWKAEPVRLIIRRVPFSVEQIARLKGSRRLRTIHPQQLELALDGKMASVYGY